jgi:PKD repeat protein
MQLARLVGLCLLVANLGAIAAPPQRQAISPDLIDALESTVPCAQSPFGKASPVIRDLEPMVLHWGTGGTFFDEYTPATVGPPLTRVYRANLMQAPLPTETLRKSVSVDLNGDGRDEVVAAFSDGADVRVAVYSRTTGPTAQIIDTWSFSEQVDQYSVDIVAGDFDGSNDKQKEIALSWNIAGGNVRVVVLKGDASAHIVQADNATAGNFVTAQPSLGFPRLAVGDFLLAGRDQLILASYSTLAGSFVFHLLELDDGSNPTSEVPSPAMVPSGTAMRFNSFVHLTGAPNAFTIDDSPNIAMQTSGGIGVIEGLDAHGGDVVDTAAAELVLHVMFPEPVNPVSHVLVQRVLHFITTRNGSNQITGIQLGTVSFLGTSLNYADSTIMLERYTTEASNPYPPKFAVAVDDIDSVAYKEIVTARVGHDGAHGLSFGPLVWYAHKVGVRITPSFQWQNQGLDIGTNEPIVQFTNNSRGSISTYDWDFGDGSPHSSSINPAHRYNTTGTKTVTLTATAYDSTQFVYQHSVNVRNDGGSDANPQGDAPPLRIYRINPIAAFAPDQPASNPNTDLDTSAFYVYPTLGIDKTVVRIGVSDMDRDSLPEVVITVNNDGQAVDTHVFSRRAAADGTFRRKTLEDNVVGDTNVDLVMSDFDGDSLNAELSSTSGDCHAVTDVTIHSVTYFPPYFALLQTNSNRAARYGKSSSSSTSTEDRSASYISHDVTAARGFG